MPSGELVRVVRRRAVASAVSSAAMTVASAVAVESSGKAGVAPPAAWVMAATSVGSAALVASAANVGSAAIMISRSAVAVASSADKPPGRAESFPVASSPTTASTAACSSAASAASSCATQLSW